MDSGSRRGKDWPRADGSRHSSDGVLAIVITLLVLDLRAPQDRGAMLRQLLEQWPAYVAYLASFAYAGVIWVNHHQLFTRIAAVDTGLLWRNLSAAADHLRPAVSHRSARQRLSGTEICRDQAAGLIFYALAGGRGRIWARSTPPGCCCSTTWRTTSGCSRSIRRRRFLPGNAGAP